MSQTRWLTIAALVLALVASDATAQGLRWETNLEAAQRLAAQTNRLVLVHFSAPWCGPCQRLEQTVFSKPGFGQTLEPQYVAVKLSFDQHKALANQMGVSSIPADVILTPQGQFVQKLISPPTNDQYVGAMQQIAAQYRQSAPPGYPANIAAAPAAAPQVTAQPVALGPPPAYAGPAYVPASAAAPLVGAPNVPIAQRPPEQPAVVGSPYAAAPPMANNVLPPVAAVPVSQPPINPPPVAAPHAAPPAAVVNYASAEQKPPAGKLAVDPSVLPAGSPPLGLDGYCTVSLIERKKWVAGDPLYGAIHHGRTYLFATAGEQQKFMANPEHYSPVSDGNDPVLATQGQKVPGNRTYGVTCGGRIYLFANAGTRSEFERNTARYVADLTPLRR